MSILCFIMTYQLAQFDTKVSCDKQRWDTKQKKHIHLYGSTSFNEITVVVLMDIHVTGSQQTRHLSGNFRGVKAGMVQPLTNFIAGTERFGVSIVARNLYIQRTTTVESNV
jgi:hypothetical protein